MKSWDKFPLAAACWPPLLGSLFLALCASALGVWFLAWPLWVVFALILNFFRDPARRSPAAPPGSVISPADGKVVALERVSAPLLPGGQAQVVSIFMNIFDVHVNRIPLGGKVLAVNHIPGGLARADLDKASQENERMEVHIRAPGGEELVVTQVAGMVARRIECWLTPGDTVQREARYGMIRFGSRLDVFLPLEAEIKAEKGQRVRAGETVIGEL